MVQYTTVFVLFLITRQHAQPMHALQSTVLLHDKSVRPVTPGIVSNECTHQTLSTIW